METTLNLSLPLLSFSFSLLFLLSFSPILQLRSLAVLLVSSLLRCFSAVNCPLKFPLLLIDGARSCFFFFFFFFQ